MATLTEELVAIAPLTLEAVRSLLEPSVEPCLSLYEPTHRNVPANTVDRPGFERLVDELQSAACRIAPRKTVERLLRPFRMLAADARFWRHMQDGLAVLAAGGRGGCSCCSNRCGLWP